MKEFLSTWTAANWIAFGIGASSLIWNMVNAIISSLRDKKKNRREEFDRRVARPIEVALDEFMKLLDKIEQLRAQRDAGAISEQFLELNASKSAANRALSRALRRASDSQMCGGDDWDGIGNNEFDNLSEALDAAERSALAKDREECLVVAIRQVELVDQAVRKKIEVELLKYT
ncbi:hypothetical protein [Pseudolabrys sp. FHR47]|uniref:hypothetical protein n=1 Tax=Pseudolabrys sp. FHR47 TaxID=2562284 RepID=UPI0010BF3A6F|nr:hypothetical protein [Pseudolabrys sp. FHR47]